MQLNIKKKKVSEMPLLDNITPESIIMVVDGDTNYKYPLENIIDGCVESVESTDNHIQVDNTDPKNPKLSFTVVDNENFVTDDEKAVIENTSGVNTGDQDLSGLATKLEIESKADLVNGLVPSSQLPSYVDDVIEVANFAALPVTGESGKIYITQDDNLTYRWSGTGYAEISKSLALGETSGTAYRGDRGKTAYDHSQTTGNPHGTTASDVGASPLGHTHSGETINPEAIDFDTTPSTDPNTVGRLQWSATEKTLEFGVEGGTIDVNKELFDYYVDTNNNLGEGNVVSVTGISGNRQAVTKTDNTNRASATACIGMVTHKNADNTVRVTKKGRVRKLNTGGMTEGLPVYANATGGFTQTAPTAPNYFIHVGVVEVAHAVNGIIDVDIQIVYNLDDASNVDGTDTTIADTDEVLKKDTAGLWKKVTWANVKTLLNGIYAKLSGGNTFSGKQVFVGDAGSANSFEVRNGNATGSLLIGADVNASTKTNNVRKLARFTVPSFSDITKNHQVFGADFDNATIAEIEFGGSVGGTQLGATVIGFNTVPSVGSAGGVRALSILKDSSTSHLAGKYNYEAANHTADTVNDIRTSNVAGVKIEEICTVANATKGGGTWLTTKRTDTTGVETLPAIKLTSGGSYVNENGGTIYHITRWFTPTSALTIAANGLSATITSGQFTSAMTGAKLRLTGGVNEPIITYVSSNSITLSFAVDSSFFGQSVAVADWGVYGRKIYQDGNNLLFSPFNDPNKGFGMNNSGGLTAYSGLNVYLEATFQGSFGLTDVFFKRISTGLFEINSGAVGVLRDLKLRSLFADKIIPNSDTTGVVIMNAADTNPIVSITETPTTAYRSDLKIGNANNSLATITFRTNGATTDDDVRLFADFYNMRADCLKGDYDFRTTNGYLSRFFIKNNGNIGIATIAPETKLDVNGSTTLRDWVYRNITTAHSGDAIGDRRTNNVSGVVTTERFTGTNATKGSGTKVVESKILADGSHQFGDDTNNVTILANGTIKLNGTATVFDDKTFDALALVQTGAGISLNNAECTVAYLTTANNADYMIAAPQFSHARKNGAVIFPHIHFEQAQNAVPNFALQYRWQINGGAKVTAWTAVKCNTLAFPYVSGTLNQIAYVAGGITPPAGDGISDICQFRIIRDTTNALGLAFGADPYTATVQVSSFDVHVEIDQLGGSNEEYVK